MNVWREPCALGVSYVKVQVDVPEELDDAGIETFLRELRRVFSAAYVHLAPRQPSRVV